MKTNTNTDKTALLALPRGNAAEFEALLRASMDDLLLKTRTHQDAWNFGEDEQWLLDEGSGEVLFIFPEVVVSAPAQVIGTFDTVARTWTWAWDDESLPEFLKEDALKIRQYGEQHGLQHLILPAWEAEETHCWYMAALACSLCGAAGAYRGVTGETYTFISFRDVVTNPVNESGAEVSPGELATQAVDEFKACLEDPDQQRQACCRYLKRGSLAGVGQDELIHRLGLAAPSVLDLAGYSADQSDTVMGMLRTITDEEIVECQT